jgi:hypothetical protein
MSSLKPLIIITSIMFIDRHWAGGIIKFGSSNRATDLIIQILIAVLLLAIAHSSYLSGDNCPRSTSETSDTNAKQTNILKDELYFGLTKPGGETISEPEG